jgi:hypothetical protein
MDTPLSFLTISERAEFDKPGRFIPRHVAELPKDEYIQRSPEAKGCISVLVEQIQKVSNRDGKWSGFLCVEVNADDGMSWSAEGARTRLGRDYGGFHLWCLSDKLSSAESLPPIADFIGKYRFIRLARKHGLTKSFAILSPWAKALIFLFSIILGAVIAIHASYFQLIVGNTGWNLEAEVVVNAMALGLLGSLLQYLFAKLTTGPDSGQLIDFARGLEERERKDSIPYGNFLESLAESLQSTHFPRFVVVDNYQRLDSITKRVLFRYFEQHLASSKGSEFWIVFDTPHGDSFANKVISNTTACGYYDTRIFTQLLLNSAEKSDLVRRIGRPPMSVDYTTIKSVCHEGGAGEQRVRELLREYRVNHPPDMKVYDVVDFLFLISLTASDVYLNERSLLEHLSKRDLRRSKVLKEFLRGTHLTKHELHTRLIEMKNKFPSLLVTESSGLQAVKLFAEVAKVLSENSDKWGLADSAMGHLFWALYWYDKQQNQPVGGEWVRKISHHLLGADLEKVSDEQGDIHIQLFEAYLFAIEGSLKTCWLGKTRLLVENAAQMLDAPELQQDAERLRNRLMSLCWEAYSVLGDEDLLGVLVQLRETAPVAPGASGGDGFLLEDVFLQLVPMEPSARAAISPNLLFRTGVKKSIADSASDYAKARSAWFVLLVSPWLHNLDMLNLAKSLHTTHASLPDIMNRSIERVAKGNEEGILVTDILTISLSLWCSVLELQRPDLIRPSDPYDLLGMCKTVVSLASQLKEQASVTSQSIPGYDFLLNGLARELCAVSLAAVVETYDFTQKVQMVKPLLGDRFLDRVKGILDVAADVLDKLPRITREEDLISNEMINRTTALLKLCAIMWKRFGLDRLCDFLNLRRAHFDALCGNAGQSNYSSLLATLGPGTDLINLTGLLSNLVAATCMDFSSELSAFYLMQAGRIALDADFDDRLRQELCVLVVKRAHSAGYNLKTFLEFLTRED